MIRGRSGGSSRPIRRPRTMFAKSWLGWWTGASLQDSSRIGGAGLRHAYLHGYPVGIIGNNGPIFSEVAVKGAHFIELCDQRNIPLLFLQNITGFMVGSEAERAASRSTSEAGLCRGGGAGAALHRADRRLYGAGNYGMCGRGFEPRFLFSWPNSRIATMSPDIATNVLLELRRPAQAGRAGDAELAELERRTRAQFTEQSDPYYATARLWDDGIIEPAQTRDVLGLSWRSPPRAAETGRSPVYRM